MQKRLSLLSFLSIFTTLQSFLIDSRRNTRPLFHSSQINVISTRDLSCSADLKSRRDIFATAFLSGFATLVPPSIAATREPLDELLYRIVRVREATLLETRLIRTGKFKDVQRANIKLAVRFMVENYRLNDAFVAASTYLDGTSRRLEASQIGQSATQNLYTILEYFDAADVQNLKVGQTSLSNKEEIVLKGLDATRKNIDDFLAFFPASDLTSVNARVAQENALNVKEFDTSLGPLINMPATE